MQIAGFKSLSGMTMFVKWVSIWSMAGMTVARFGVAREKNSVASFKIWGGGKAIQVSVWNFS